MHPRIPHRWLASWAQDDPHRVALITPSSELTFHELDDMVRARAEVLRSSVGDGLVRPIPVTLSVSSVVEVLAVSAAGAVPLPFGGSTPPIGEALSVPGDLITIPTSGSTGVPSIVRITDANVEASVLASRSRLGTGPDDRWLLCLPIHHVGGLSVVWRSLEAGGSIAMAPFDPDLPAFIEHHRPTVASMVPTMVHRLVRAAPSTLASVDRILIGGARISRDLIEAATGAGVSLAITYGATETTSQVATTLDPSDGIFEPLVGVTVSIVGEDGSSLGVGEHGAIMVDGPVVSPGYLGHEPRTGPYRTGDIGSLDPSGLLRIHGRSDDMIVTGGENVYLNVVGDAVRAISGVSDAYVLGVASPEWGTEIVAVVVSGRPEAALDAAVRDTLAPHEIPKRWVKLDRLPMLDNHKHDRAALQRVAELG